jgi:hypothetical protein
MTLAVDLVKNFKAVLVDIVEDGKSMGTHLSWAAGIFLAQNYCDVLFHFQKWPSAFQTRCTLQREQQVVAQVLLLDELSIPERKVQ